MIRQMVGLTAALVLLFSAGASAEEFAGDGTYVNLSGLVGIDVNKSDGSVTNGGIGFAIGKFLGPRASMEAEYQWLNDIAHTLTYNIKIYAAVERVQPFVKAGIGFTSTADGTLTGAWRAGVGFDVYMTDSWKLILGAEYLDAFGKAPLRHVVAGVGIGYHFY